MKTDKRIDGQFYIAGWCCLLLAGCFYMAVSMTDAHILHLVPGCVFHYVTGLYCPGCGGTRAVLALMHGKLWRSFGFHPVVPYTACVGGWFMISQTIERITKGRVPVGMHFREIYLWIALVLVVANCLVKNIALLVFHTDLLVVL